MPQEFLHGVELVEVDSATRPIRTVKSSIIGLVGTAPDSEGAIKATLDIGSVALNNGINISADTAGLLGNDITLRIFNPGTNSATLAITVVDKAITVSLATNSSAAATTTAAQLVTAIAANTAAAALIDVVGMAGSSGAGIVPVTATTSLKGGLDEAFPLNQPVLLSSNRLEAARLGLNGSLPDAIDGIYDQIGALCVVVRVAQSVSDSSAQTLTNIIGGVNGSNGDFEGMQALFSAESKLGVVPRILIAPGFTHQASVLTSFVTVAERLKAIIVADGTNTTDAAAQVYAQGFGSKRIYLVDPGVVIFKDGVNVNAPASSRVAGVIAKVDNDLGFWHSPSNKEINGIVGTKRAVDFTLNDANCRANVLNSQNITTIIRKEGYRVWGNRTLSSDQKWAFLSVTRTADLISDSILRAHLWAVDKNITKNYLELVANEVTAYLQILKAEGAIAGGKCYPDPDLNIPENFALGKVYFNFDFAPYYPAEHITFRQILNNGYLADLVQLNS